MKPVMYEPKDVAVIMGVDPATVRNMCKRGEIPHRKAGRLFRIPIQWVEDWKNADAEISA